MYHRVCKLMNEAWEDRCFWCKSFENCLQLRNFSALFLGKSLLKLRSNKYYKTLMPELIQICQPFGFTDST